jgi:hypothetical protein
MTTEIFNKFQKDKQVLEETALTNICQELAPLNWNDEDMNIVKDILYHFYGVSRDDFYIYDDDGKFIGFLVRDVLSEEDIDKLSSYLNKLFRPNYSVVYYGPKPLGCDGMLKYFWKFFYVPSPC